MRVNTNELKRMLSYVARCKSNNLLEITNYIELVFNNEGLTITGTDGSNHVIVTSKNVNPCPAQTIIVKSDQFIKLVNKTTVQDITLEVKESYLEVKGNGIYKVEIVEDETYPKLDLEVSKSFKINNSDLSKGILSGRCAKSQSPGDGVLYGYLFREKSITTADAIKVCCVGVTGENLDNLEFLLNPNLAMLATSLDKDVVDVEMDKSNNRIRLSGETVTVIGALMEGADSYPQVSSLLFEEFPNVCELDTQLVLQAIDRLGLFVGMYDKGILTVAFVKGAVVLRTSSNSTETLPHVSGTHTDDCVITINGRYLYDLVSVISDSTFTLYYGLEHVVKMESTEQIQLLATADDEE